MQSKERIVCVISSLDGGGAERVMALLANAWVEKGLMVDVLQLAGEAVRPIYPLDPKVKWVPLDVAGTSRGLCDGILKNMIRINILRRSFRNAEGGVILSFGTETNILVILAALGCGRRVVVSERCDPRYAPSSRIWRLLRTIVYRFASAVVVQTQDAARHLSSALNPFVVPNPVVPRKATTAPVAVSGPMLLAAGRLERQKGFDVLIDAFAEIAGTYRDRELVILGEGPERRNLESQVRRLGLEGRVVMPGRVANPEDYMAQAEIFVLSSRFEGFPNVLLEAMSYGCPVLAADCPSGPAEIVENERNGLLVPADNVPAMACGLRRLLESSDLRRKLGERAAQAAEKFSLEGVMTAWSNVLFRSEKTL